MQRSPEQHFMPPMQAFPLITHFFPVKESAAASTTIIVKRAIEAFILAVASGRVMYESKCLLNIRHNLWGARRLLKPTRALLSLVGVYPEVCITHIM